MALRPFRILSFCSGIGGLDVGVKHAIGTAATTVAYVEGEAFCAAVLQARMGQGLDEAPIWDDVKTFDARAWRGAVDCIIGGYPCQPWSNAGKRKGKDDPRHLWPWIAEHIQTIKPAFVFCENVAGHLAMGFEQVCEDLSAMDYSVEAGIFSAEEIGAPHRRERLFFLAHANGHAIRQHGHNEQSAICAAHVIGDDGKQRHVANTDNNLWRQQCTCGQSLGGQDDSVHARRQKDFSQSAVCCQSLAHATRSRCDEGERRQSRALRHKTQWSQSQRLGRKVANANCDRLGAPRTVRVASQNASAARSNPPVCDATSGNAESGLGQPFNGTAYLVDAPLWGTHWEDGVPRVTDEKQFRIDRLRALGNAVVPATAALAWRTLYAQALNAQTDSEAPCAE